MTRTVHARRRCFTAAFLLFGLSAELPAQLVAEWRMDESEWSGATGEVIDASGSGNDGTARGQDTVPTTVPGRVCRAGRFRGQGFNIPEDPFYVDAQHYVEIPDADGLSPLAEAGAMSIGGWFRPESLDGTLLHKGEGGAGQEYQVYIDGNRLSLRLWDRFGSPVEVPIGSAGVTVGQWHFFTATVERLGNSPNVRVRGYLYDTVGLVGGRSQRVVSLAYRNKPLDGRTFLGGISFGGQPVNFFDGLLDEIRIHADVRSQSHIEAHWSANRPCPRSTELLLEYGMDQAAWSGEAGEVADLSGNGRDGTPVDDADTDGDDPAIPGNPGSCRYGVFDGASDGIVDPDAGSYLNGLDAITVMAWIYNTADLAGNNRGIFFTNDSSPGQDNRLGMRYDESGFFGGGDDVIKASVFTDECSLGDECLQVETVPGVMVRDQWQHVAMTWRSGGPIRVFVDGSEVGISAVEGTGGNGTIDAVAALDIGQGAKGQRWQGRIDEFRIFDGALDESDIRDWRDRTAPCRVIAPDHLRLLHPGTGLTCQPARVTVQACEDAACSTLFDEQITVALTSPAANWVPNPVTFTGQTAVDLQVTTPGAVVLDAESDPAADYPTRCFTGGAETCSMEWFETGFLIDVADHVAGSMQQATIAAVRTDDQTRRCTARFANETRTVGLWSEYLNPGTGTERVFLDGTPLADASPGTGVALSFDGQGVASVTVSYDDAGGMLFGARFEGTGEEAGLVMTGQDPFVTRPATFALTVPSNPAATDASGSAFVAAGSEFRVEVQARNANGGVTPNFGRESPPEGVRPEIALVAPAGGASPALLGDFGDFGEDCDGNTATAGSACGRFAWPEVGIVEITPRLASGAYLGTEDVVGPASEPVGRFIPAHFTLTAGNLTDRIRLSGCSTSFTYFGEPLGADWTLEARNAAGVTTANYEGAFARLRSAQLGIDADEPLTVDSAALAWSGGFGTATAVLRADRDVPAEPVPDFRVGTAPVDEDGVRLRSPDVDFDDDGVTEHALIGSTELRYGRASMDNAVGSELGPLVLPLRIEHFADSTWMVNAADDCTAFALADHVELASSSGDTGTGSASVSLGTGSTAIQETSPITVSGGTTGFTFSAPGSPGWVDLDLLLGNDWPFLRDDLDADGDYDDEPSARASFGLFDGNEGRILLQEIPPGG